MTNFEQQPKLYYLYVKTHRVTGLKYLGYTSRKDPYIYLGSGIWWRAHLKKYGAVFDTEILLTTDIYESIVEKGKYYSELWDVVKSKDWANLKAECGDGGAYEFTIEDREKVSKGLKGKKKSPEAVANIVAARKRNGTYIQSPESLEKRSQAQRGRPKSPEHKAKIAAALKGKKKSPEAVMKSVEAKKRNRQYT